MDRSNFELNSKPAILLCLMGQRADTGSSDMSQQFHTMTTLERAFELAGSGECATLDAIRKKLDAEGYQGAQVSGPALAKQIRALLAAVPNEPREAHLQRLKRIHKARFEERT